ncbi:hypothetical protein KC19_VG048500 [Ceratodon purpureus]|uniref:Uncharacterized protein n=1 Tax=Ceratodon purpureus TaxID=3225 RepID=A0A8T0HM26_CERPU|nr:hypothetical protein KC19_VG048500 [Ceratodon purpureus]
MKLIYMCKFLYSTHLPHIFSYSQSYMFSQAQRAVPPSLSSPATQHYPVLHNTDQRNPVSQPRPYPSHFGTIPAQELWTGEQHYTPRQTLSETQTPSTHCGDGHAGLPSAW